MLETKIFLSYILICLYYTLCRLHYLIVLKADEDFNEVRDELIALTGNKNIMKVLVVFNILFCPITAPLSMVKRFFKLIFPKKKK